MLCRTEIKNLVAAGDILAKVIKALKKFRVELVERTDGLENFAG